MFVRAFYPVLVRPDETHPDEVENLTRLEYHCGWCLYLAIAAPFFALLAVLLSSEENAKGWMIGLIVIGGLCGGLAIKFVQIIRRDLATLMVAIDPQREASSITSDTVSSLWTGTR